MEISACIWFDSEAEEAAKFYSTVFKDATLGKVTKYNTDTPSDKPIGSVLTAEFEIGGFTFMGLNGGPLFKPNPSISFFVDCQTPEELDGYYEQLNAKVLMPLDKYPFSDRYAWVEDKYGVSWQLILTKPEGDERPKIVPCLLFVQDNYGNAEEAVNFYIEQFNGKIGNLLNYEQDDGMNKKGTVMFSDFKIKDTWLAAMDGGGEHAFQFSEGISFVITCEDQAEIDSFYDKLSAVPESEVCGWLKDKFGVSWQLVTPELDALLEKKEAMEALLKMKRLDISKLKAA